MKKKEEEKKEAAQPLACPECEKLRSQAEEYLNGWKRSRADYENLQKEMQKEKSEFARYANANLIIELLPIMDNFKMAFKQIPQAEENSAWVIGFSHIKKQLSDFLASNWVTEIKTINEKFDPTVHEAVETKKIEGVEAGVIIEERAAGYKLYDKVIQAAKVIVSE